MYRDNRDDRGDRYNDNRDRGGYRDNNNNNRGDNRRRESDGGDRFRDRERDIDRKRPRHSYDGYDNRGGGGNGDRGGDRRGGGGGGPPRFDDRDRQSNRYDEAADIESRLNSLIIRVGDKSTSSLEHNLDALASALETDIPSHRKGILDILLKCVLAQPVKTPVYGTLVGLLNIKNFDFGGDVVEKATNLLEAKLNERDLLSVKLLVRFFAELSNANVVQASSLMALFDNFLSICDEDISAGNPQDQTDFFATPVIAALPWCGAELSRSSEDQLKSLVDRIDGYMTKRKHRGVLFDPFNQPANWPDRLDHVWKQILALRDDDWAITTTLRPYVHFESRLLTAQQHVIPTFKLPLHPDGPQQYPLPLALFRVFDPSVSDQDVRGAERFVLEEYIIDLLFFFNSSHKDGVKFMTQLPVSFNIDYILVETILSQMFLLPKPPFKEIFYAVLFIDFFKIQQSIIPVFAEAVENLFNRLDEMDTECINRFSNWFSIHLSNFDYKWTWSSWDYILSDDALPTTTTTSSPTREENAPPASGAAGNELRRRFVSDVLERLVRLAYWERIRPTIPEDFVNLLPSKPAPYFKYDDEMISSENPDTEAGMLARSLLSRIRMKETSENLLKYIDVDIAPKVTPELKLEIVVQSLLQAGCKSFSHLLNTIERSIGLLNGIVKTAQHRHLVIESVAAFWSKSAQHIIILLDKLMTYKVIDGAAIVNWLFDHGRSNSFHSYVWEILTNTVNKTLARCETLKRELNSARDLATEKIKALEQVIEQAQREQKELFIAIFQRFATVISEYLQNHPAEGIWYHTILGYFKALGRRYIEEIRPFIGVLETLLFANAEPSAGVTATFNQLKLMCNPSPNTVKRETEAEAEAE